MLKTFDKLPYLTLKTNSRDELYSRRAHSHQEISLGYIESGSTLIEVDQQKYTLRSGDMVLIPAETIHICKPEDLRNYSFQMLYLDQEWWTRNIGAGQFRTLAIPAPVSIKHFIEQIAHGPSAEVKSSSLEELLRSSLMPLLDSAEAMQDSGMESIHKQIREMPHLPVGIEDFAEQAGMNKYSFIRRYARIYGLTPHADMVNMRIQRAILLFESDMDLTEISMDCGFTDQSHFIKQFKLYTGMKPGEYRQAIKK